MRSPELPLLPLASCPQFPRPLPGLPSQTLGARGSIPSAGRRLQRAQVRRSASSIQHKTVSVTSPQRSQGWGPARPRRSRHPAQVRSKLTRVAETQTRTLPRSGGSPSGSLDSHSAGSGRRGGGGAAPAPACRGSPVVARGGPGRSCVPSCHERMPLSLTETSFPGLPAGIDEK